MRIYFVRNCSSLKEGVGWPVSGEPLSKKGKQESLILAKSLTRIINEQAEDDLAAIYSSDHLRAIQTIEPFAKGRGFEIRHEPKFRSIDLGDYYGKPLSEIRALLGEAEFAEALSNPVPDKRYFPNGESLDEQSKRVWSSINEIAEHYKADSDWVIVSTHATCIQGVLCGICGIPLSNVWMWKIPTSAITIVEWSEGRWFIHQVGCTPQ